MAYIGGLKRGKKGATAVVPALVRTLPRVSRASMSASSLVHCPFYELGTAMLAHDLIPWPHSAALIGCRTIFGTGWLVKITPEIASPHADNYG